MKANSKKPQNKSQKNINSHNNTKKTIPKEHIQDNSHSKVDLKQLDANEESLSSYTYPKEFLKLDLEKIREFIDILEEHYQNLIEKEKISEAKLVKQRLNLLKNLEKEKMKKEAKIIYSNQRELVQDKMNEELNTYLETTNTEFNSLLKAFESQDNEMNKAHKNEIEEFKNNFDKFYENKKNKPSKQILNWIKIRDYAIKQNNFDKVEEATNEIDKLKKIENKKNKIEKDKLFNIEIDKITKKHENEKNAIEIKKNNIIEMFNQTKNKNIEQIKKKYEAKMKELKNYQNFELSNFDKISKGIAKPCSRIQNIMSATTGIKMGEKNNENDNENEDGDKNEIKGGEEYDEEEDGRDNEEKGKMNKNEENEENQINENNAEKEKRFIFNENNNEEEDENNNQYEEGFQFEEHEEHEDHEEHEEHEEN